MAILLIDNAVELNIHTRCEMLLVYEGSQWSLGQMSRKDYCDASSKYFDDKLKLLARRKILSEAEARFIKYAHQLRNDSAHNSFFQESVIHEVSHCYHDIACDLLPRMTPGIIQILKHVDASEPVQELITKSAGTGLFPANHLHKAVSESLKNMKPEMSGQLSNCLSISASGKIDRIFEGLKFLASDGLGTEDLEIAISHVQFYDQYDSDAARKFVGYRNGDAVSFKRLRDYIDSSTRLLSSSAI